MSNRTVEGRVLSQSRQTQVLFTPPSPAGSSFLPDCVTAARAGGKWFAMNHETQLQFNVTVPHNPSNLRTLFKPTPSPITIERFPHHGRSADQLTLALKLARRDLCRGLLRPPLPPTYRQEPVSLTCPFHPPLSAAYKPPISTHHLPANSYHSGDGRSADVQPSLGAQRSVDGRTADVPMSLGAQRSVDGRTADVPTSLGAQRSVDGRTVNLPTSLGAQRSVDGRTADVPTSLGAQRSVDGRTADLPAGKVQPRWSGKGKGGGQRLGHGDSKRVLWEEREREEERERRRAEELAARNGRMVYSLRRQVEALERETQCLSSRHTKKSRAVHRLMAARRAAVRTLRLLLAPSFSPPTLPSELPLLVQRLSLLSAKLKDVPTRELGNSATGGRGPSAMGVQGTATGELGNSATGGRGPSAGRDDKLEELMEQLSQLHAAAAGSRHLPSPDTATNRRAVKKGKQQGRRSPSARRRRRGTRGVVFRRHQRAGTAHKHTLKDHTHFSQPTYSSECKQKPAQKHFASPRGKSQPHPPPTTPSPQWTLKGSQPHPPPTTPSPYGSSQPHPPPTIPSPIHSHPRSMPERADVQLARPQPVPAGHRGSCELEDKLTVPPEECSEEPENGLPSRPHPSLDASVSSWQGAELCQPETESGAFLQPRLAVGEADAISDQVSDRLLADTLEESQRREWPGRRDSSPSPPPYRLEDGAGAEQAAQALLQVPDVQALLGRLAKIEMEEDRCRQKWTTISYDAQPPKLPASKGAVDVPSYGLPPTSLSNIHLYRDHYQQHQQLTTVTAKAGVDPWSFAESLADQLLDGILESVSMEVNDACDGYVEGLYSEEFLSSTK